MFSHRRSDGDAFCGDQRHRVNSDGYCGSRRERLVHLRALSLLLLQQRCWQNTMTARNQIRSIATVRPRALRWIARVLPLKTSHSGLLKTDLLFPVACKDGGSTLTCEWPQFNSSLQRLARSRSGKCAVMRLHDETVNSQRLGRVSREKMR